MSCALVVPADDSQPIVLRELSGGATFSSQARQLFGGLWEVVRARGLHQLAPSSRWPWRQPEKLPGGDRHHDIEGEGGQTGAGDAS